MDKSLLIGKYIYHFLSTSQDILQYVDADNIFPLLANLKLDENGNATDVTFPFVTFERTSVKPIYTKLLEVAENEIEIVVSCVSTDYDESIDIINAVRNLFECKHFQDEEIAVSNITVKDVSEDYDLDTFIQHITFTMNVRTR